MYSNIRWMKIVFYSIFNLHITKMKTENQGYELFIAQTHTNTQCHSQPTKNVPFYAKENEKEKKIRKKHKCKYFSLISYARIYLARYTFFYIFILFWILNQPRKKHHIVLMTCVYLAFWLLNIYLSIQMCKCVCEIIFFFFLGTE